MVRAAAGAPSIPPMDPGSYNAVLYQVAHVGQQEDEWQGKTRLRDVIHFAWEVFNTSMPDNPNKRRAYFAKYTFIVADRSTFYKDLLLPWFNMSLEGAKEFDIEKILGYPCRLHLVVKKADSGREFNAISHIERVASGEGKNIDTQNAKVFYSVTEHDDDALSKLPDFIQEQAREGLRRYQESSGGFADAGAPKDANPADFGFPDSAGTQASSGGGGGDDFFDNQGAVPKGSDDLPF